MAEAAPSTTCRPSAWRTRRAGHSTTSPTQAPRPPSWHFSAATSTHLTESPAEVGTHVQAGKLKMLGIMANERIAAFGNVPTFKERKIDLASSTWRGLAAPRGTPAPVIDTMRSVARNVAADPVFKDGLNK